LTPWAFRRRATSRPPWKVLVSWALSAAMGATLSIRPLGGPGPTRRCPGWGSNPQALRAIDFKSIAYTCSATRAWVDHTVRKLPRLARQSGIAQLLRCYRVLGIEGSIGPSMEVSALTHPSAMPGLRGPSALLRLQSDERLISLTRRGQPVAPVVLLPPHAQLARGRRGRPAGGLRRGLQRRSRRRARDQRAPMALPHRAQPLAQPPSPHLRHRRGLDGRALLRERPLHQRQGAAQGELPRADRRRPRAPRDPAHGAAAARDRRALL